MTQNILIRVLLSRAWLQQTDIHQLNLFPEYVITKLEENNNCLPYMNAMNIHLSVSSTHLSAKHRVVRQFLSIIFSLVALYPYKTVTQRYL
jgi:hypothetical protein